MAKNPVTYDYDVCLSFAGENRAYVEEVASDLFARGIRVFYDKYEEVELWGKDLYVHLDHEKRFRGLRRFCLAHHCTRENLQRNEDENQAKVRHAIHRRVSSRRDHRPFYNDMHTL